ncbi:alpha/beta hydrolase [Burkholderia sp. Cy-637]|nr:alpha/beta hydrolase [Burkholderia sp. Cy-637]
MHPRCRPGRIQGNVAPDHALPATFIKTEPCMRKQSLRLLAGAGILATGLGWAYLHPLAWLNAMVPRTGHARFSQLAYGADPRQGIDIYVPTASPTARRPMVVFFYGGSWQGGLRADYRFVGEALSSRGMVVAIPDYRVFPQVTFPGFVEDAAAAVRWARDHAAVYGADPDRLFLAGHSAGAQIALLLATDRSWLARAGLPSHALAGVIGLAGPYDFLPLRDSTLERIFPASQRTASQPIDFVRGGEPPILLGVGMRDDIVDPGNTERMAARLRAHGDAVQVRRYPRLTHEMMVGSLATPLIALKRLIPVGPVLDDVTDFVDAH